METKVETTTIETTASPQAHEDHNCVVCAQKEANGKYKCPKCKLRYCSVKCCQIHKKSGTCVVEDMSKELNNMRRTMYSQQLPPPSSSSGTEEAYKRLKIIVKSHRLQDWIKMLDSSQVNSKQTAHLFDDAMENQEFLEFTQLVTKIQRNKDFDSEDTSDNEF